MTFEGPIFGLTDAAKAVGISTSYLRHLIGCGKAVPSVPVADGRRKVFSAADMRRLSQDLNRPLLIPLPGEAPQEARR